VLEAPAAAFLQANTPAASLLYACLGRLAEPYMRAQSTQLWDLYCGVGGIGLSLAKSVLHITGFEHSREAVACASRNAWRNGLPNCSFIAGDVAQQARRSARTMGSPDLIITDPPRAGLKPEMLTLLLELQAKAIIAVSCDPASQARDLARLAAAYQVCHIQPFDFFPHTPHVESVVLLERRSSCQ